MWPPYLAVCELPYFGIVYCVPFNNNNNKGFAVSISVSDKKLVSDTNRDYISCKRSVFVFACRFQLPTFSITIYDVMSKQDARSEQRWLLIILLYLPRISFSSRQLELVNVYFVVWVRNSIFLRAACKLVAYCLLSKRPWILRNDMGV